MKDVFVIAIAGGSGSGKTTLAKKIQNSLPIKSVIISQDNYYFDQSDRFDGDGGSVNFDHPSSIDFNLLKEHLNIFKSYRGVEIPTYCFKTHKRKLERVYIEPHEVVIIDGTLILTQENLIPVFDRKIFVDIPEDIRFQRRLLRDIKERGRTEEGVRKQFFSQVKPMHDEFVEPSKTSACVLANDLFDITFFLKDNNFI